MYTRLPPSSSRFGLLPLLSIALLLIACGRSAEDNAGANSGDAESGLSVLPMRVLADARLPDFENIQANDFPDRIGQAMKRAERAVDHIANQAGPATLDNTLLALEPAGQVLSDLAAVLHGLRQVQAEFEWQEIHHQLAPLLAEHSSRMRTHQGLYQRLQQLADGDQDDWCNSKRRLLSETLRSMRQAGAGLPVSEQQRLAQIERQLTELSSLFKLNLERETQRFELHLDQTEQLAGLTSELIDQAAKDARDRGHEQGWVFTLNAHSLFPFLRHSRNRALRQSLYQAWQRRAGGMRYGQVRDNPELIRRIASLRAQRAQLLGYPNHLELTLADSSIGSYRRIEQMLDSLERAARPRAESELIAIRALMDEDGIDDDPRPWDWWHYRQRLASSLESNWPAPTLAQVKAGMFGLASQLWGLSFEFTEELPLWHQSVQAYVVKDHDGTLLGWLYLDLKHRPGKAGGAWISQYPGHDPSSGRSRPLVAAMANLASDRRAGEDRLELAETETLLHEFGHALHVLMSTVEATALAGTSVPGDFVEFPALLFERWAAEPAWLESFLPDIDTSDVPGRQENSSRAYRRSRLSGLETLEQIAATRIDLAFHAQSKGDSLHLNLLEQQLTIDMDLPALLSPRHRHDGYARLFGGHRAGQEYRNLWSELLAADAFGLFIEQGVLDTTTADRLRREVLSRGNSRPPMESWEAFRGRPPRSEALINERGLR